MKELLLEESKSMANRILIVKSFSQKPLPTFRSQANDVVELAVALKKLRSGESEFAISEGGTAFRFLLARVSRESGEYFIRAGERLLSRPHQPLYDALKELGVDVEVQPQGVAIRSKGWQPSQSKVSIDSEKSTQFASAILLSTIDLDPSLEVEAANLKGSIPYWEMTKEIVAKHQTIECEIDMSSAFSAAALGVVAGGICLNEIASRSLQADFVFVELLKKMAAKVEYDKTHQQLRVFPSSLSAIDVNLQQSPDLFPVLAALCSLAKGESHLSGLESLAYKESDRLKLTIELLQKAGVVIEKNGAGVTIAGSEGVVVNSDLIQFDPDQDHRMAMAAAVLKRAGYKISVTNPEVVNKSFPGFWQRMGVQP